MIVKAEAQFTTAVTGKQRKVVDGRAEVTELRKVDGGLDIIGELVPGTPLEHEMLVHVLGEKDQKNLSATVTCDVEPVTEKLTFKVRFQHKQDIVAAANARLQDRQDADDKGLPLHIHLENKAKEAEKAAAK